MLSANWRRLNFAVLRFTASNIYATKRAKRGSNTMQFVFEPRAFLLQLTYERLNKCLWHLCILASGVLRWGMVSSGAAFLSQGICVGRANM
jgi:hypothetical protein